VRGVPPPPPAAKAGADSWRPDVSPADAYSQALAQHARWWHAWFPRSFISAGDVTFESYYWIQVRGSGQWDSGY
jgi:alpha-L-fucosidase 2